MALVATVCKSTVSCLKLNFIIFNIEEFPSEQI